jgi:hypothetical protein
MCISISGEKELVTGTCTLTVDVCIKTPWGVAPSGGAEISSPFVWAACREVPCLLLSAILFLAQGS